MTKVKISTDSTADIPNELCEKYDISVLPLTILIEGKEYRDGIDITVHDFYKILDSATQIPVSSQVKLESYTELFDAAYKAGYTDIVHTSINSKGSGTYQAATLARSMFYDDHPELTDKFHIHIIDSKTYSMSYGIPVIEAAEMVQNGATAEEVIEHLNEWLEYTRPVFVPLNLKCVKKSGRISPAAAFVGDAIGLKPLITFEDGEPKILSKARGEQKAIKALVDLCMSERRPNTNYALVYGSNDVAFEHLKEACAQVMDRPPIAEYNVGCVIGINTGPNMVGILYRK